MELLTSVIEAKNGNLKSVWDFVLHKKIDVIVNREISKFSGYLPDKQTINDFRSEIRLRIVDFVLHRSPTFTHEFSLLAYFNNKIKSDAIVALKTVAPIGIILSSGRIVKKNRVSLDNLYIPVPKYDLHVMSVYTEKYQAFLILLSNGILESSWTGGNNIKKHKMFLRKLSSNKNIVVFNDENIATQFTKYVTSKPTAFIFSTPINNISGEEKALMLAKRGHIRVENAILQG